MPPSRWKACRACSRSMPGPATHSTWQPWCKHLFVAPEVLQEAEADEQVILLKQHSCVGRWRLRL